MENTPNSTAIPTRTRPSVGTSARFLSGFWLPLLLLCIPVLVFGTVLFYYAINIPKWDDHALKTFLLFYERAQTFSGKLYEIVRQHNEHRIILDRLVTGLDYLLFGKLNYVHLMALGSLSLVGLVAVFAVALRRAGISLLAALPAAFFLLNLSHWENMFWGMAALQNFTVVLLVVLVLYRLSFTDSVDWLSIVLALLATGTSGNGLLVWPLGLLLVLLKKDFSGTLRWLLTMAISLRLYFIGYEQPAGNPPPKGTLVDILKGWLAFNGAGFEAFPFQTPFTICLLGGTLLTLIAGGLALYRFGQHLQGKRLSPWDLFFIGLTAFILGTGLIVAFTRVGFGLETLITSRYKIYSLLLLAAIFSYLSVSLKTASRLIILTGIGCSVLIAGLSYSTYLDETINLRKFLSTIQYNWTYQSNRPISMIDANTRRHVNNAPAFYDNCLPQLFTTVKQSPPSSIILRRENGSYIFQSADFPFMGLRDEGAYLLLRSSQRTYLFPTRQQLTGSRKAWLMPEKAFGKGFTADIPETEITAPGRYEVLLLTVDAQGACQLAQTGNVIRSEGKAATEIIKNW